MIKEIALSERVGRISISSTMAVAAEAERLRAEGKDLVDFGAGEPDFPTPENVKEAAIRGRRRGLRHALSSVKRESGAGQSSGAA